MFSQVFKRNASCMLSYLLYKSNRFKNVRSSLHLITRQMVILARISQAHGWNKITFLTPKQVRAAAIHSNTLEFEIINKKNEATIIEFLKKNFFADEPLTKWIKLLENPESVEELSKYCTYCIRHNLSLLVRNKAELSGVCLNSIKTRGKKKEKYAGEPIFGKIVKLLNHIDKEAKIFEKYSDVDNILYVEVASVHRKSQGTGVFKILINRTRELARKRGIKLLRVDCTSHFSARASEKLGMECVYSLEYKDYIVDGEQVFKPEPPHTGVKIYVQRLDS